MNNQPLISVITPMYNAENFIVETIKSVINQTYKNWEMIIVDNCSTDDSIDIVNKIKDNRIKVIKLDYNSGGPARPRNIGVENAKGEYIAFIDADDVWFPEKLKKQLYFMKRKNLNFSSHSAINIDEDSTIINKIIYIKNFLKKFRTYNIETLVKYNFIYLSSTLLQKSLFMKFNEDKECISVEDYYLWLQIFNNPDIKYGFLSSELLKYRVVNSSMSDRSIEGKQEAKARYYCLKFILDNARFDLIKFIKIRV